MSDITTMLSQLESQGKDLTDYFAHATICGALDEVQAVLMNYQSKVPILLEGSYGVGKSHLARFIAEKVLRKSIVRYGCTDQTFLEDLVGGEKLVPVEGANGTIATKSAIKKGVILQAFEGNIAFLDEFNLLQNFVQKGLNTALERNPEIRINGEFRATPKNGYGLILALNAGHGSSRDDLEPSVNDRVGDSIHIGDVPAPLKAGIALLQLGIYSTKDMIDPEAYELRGIIKQRNKLSFVVHRDGEWKSFWDNMPVQNEKSIQPYLLYKRAPQAPKHVPAELYEACLSIVAFQEQMRTIIEQGTIKLPQGFRTSYGIDESSYVGIPSPGMRQVILSIDKMQQVIHAKGTLQQAKSVAAYTLIDAIIRGQYRSMHVGKPSIREMFELVAMGNKLIDAPIPKGYDASFDPKAIAK